MVDVRPATEADCEEIYRIQIAAVRSLPGGAQGREGIEQWLSEQNPSIYASKMAEELFLVAEDNGIVGWGALNVPKKEITNVFVDPAFHRRRIGTALIGWLELHAIDSGIDVVQLQATGTAIDFYRANGYRPDPPVAPGADWALMKKSLA